MNLQFWRQKLISIFSRIYCLLKNNEKLHSRWLIVFRNTDGKYQDSFQIDNEMKEQDIKKEIILGADLPTIGFQMNQKVHIRARSRERDR